MNLKEARKRNRLTQKDVAGFLGISLPTYIKMEKSPEVISIGDAQKLAELFGISISDIFFSSNDS